MPARGARHAARAALLIAGTTVLVAACDEPGDELRVIVDLRLPVDSVETLGIDESGRFWVGRPGEAVALDATGSVDLVVPAGGRLAPELLGGWSDAVGLRAGDTLLAVSPATGERYGARAGFAGVPVLLDVRGRFLYQGAGSGAVLGFDPLTLEPLWGWAARGARTTALAAAPEGDVVWQALEYVGGEARILERDVQTGRIINDMAMADPVHAMTTAAGGDLLLAVGDGARVEVLRMRSRGGELTPVWRATVRLADGGEVRLVHAPGARAIAVFRPGGGGGLRVLELGSGSPVGAVAEAPLDAAFAPDGTLHLLVPGAISRVRLPR